MAIRNALKGGSDFSDGEVLYDYDLDDTFNTFYGKIYWASSGTVSNSTAETDLSSVSIPASDWNASATSIVLDINANVTGKYTGNNAGTTFRLYVDGTVVDSFTLSKGTTNPADFVLGGGFSYFATGVDVSSGTVIVKVTGENTLAETGTKGISRGLVVRALYNNS